MTAKIDMGIDGSGNPAAVDLEELLATRLLVQGNSGSGKSHLLRRLLEGSAGLVQHGIHVFRRHEPIDDPETAARDRRAERLFRAACTPSSDPSTQILVQPCSSREWMLFSEPSPIPMNVRSSAPIRRKISAMIPSSPFWLYTCTW